VKIGICAGILYRELDVEIRIVLGDRKTKLVGFTKVISRGGVTSADMIEEPHENNQVYDFTQEGNTKMALSK